MPVLSRAHVEPILETGVYCWCNNVNGKMYVGSASVSFRVRRNLHLTVLRAGNHHSRHLQSAWDKYGESAFSWIVLLRCPPDECVAEEQWFIDRLHTADPGYGYNLSPTAGSCLGCKHSDEASVRHSAANKTRAADPEWAAKHKSRVKVARNTVESKAKSSVASKRTHADPIIGPKMRAAMTAGVKRPEVRAKISALAKTRWSRREYRLEQSVTHQSLTQDQIKEISQRYYAGRPGYAGNMKALMCEFGVCESTIRKVLNGTYAPGLKL